MALAQAFEEDELEKRDKELDPSRIEDTQLEEMAEAEQQRLNAEAVMSAPKAEPRSPYVGISGEAVRDLNAQDDKAQAIPSFHGVYGKANTGRYKPGMTFGQMAQQDAEEERKMYAAREMAKYDNPRQVAKMLAGTTNLTERKYFAGAIAQRNAALEAAAARQQELDMQGKKNEAEFRKSDAVIGAAREAAAGQIGAAKEAAAGQIGAAKESAAGAIGAAKESAAGMEAQARARAAEAQREREARAAEGAADRASREKIAQTQADASIQRADKVNQTKLIVAQSRNTEQGRKMLFENMRKELETTRNQTKSPEQRFMALLEVGYPLDLVNQFFGKK